MERLTAIRERDLNTTMTSMERSYRQKINKETVALHDILNQMDLIDIFRSFYPKSSEYTFYSCAREMFSKLHNVLGHKTSLNKLKNTKIISSIISDYNARKVKMNHKKKTEKHTRT